MAKESGERIKKILRRVLTKIGEKGGNKGAKSLPSAFISEVINLDDAQLSMYLKEMRLEDKYNEVKKEIEKLSTMLTNFYVYGRRRDKIRNIKHYKIDI